MELNDPDITRLVADGDQLCETMKRFAIATASYFNGLLQGGLSREEAFTLTGQWHEMWLMSHLTIEEPRFNGF